ncbi:MAG: hypothetical protein A2W85_12260 [Bacteroidetes bacterium GWF2_41_31]|nr:MAG: hypothetical protein A2W85_12260 [Bacteroidetes bacterium GWF2_41_31]OFZ08380.1 MAG: hypothetical protein A2338_04400 [Bacteroidetes bacterium RIFOXYB12_FULL_41_6]
MKTNELYNKYCSKGHDTNTPTLWDLEPDKYRHLKPEINIILDRKIKTQDSQDLGFWILANYRLGFDNQDKEKLKIILIAKWHDIHEDLVDYVSEFKDEIFTEDLYKIAIDKGTYRKYDDELESTLRKCVHALKSINSPNSMAKLEFLINSGNENVKYALENYQ